MMFRDRPWSQIFSRGPGVSPRVRRFRPEVEQLEDRVTPSLTPNVWTAIGPQPVLTNTGSLAGRINVAVADPTDPNVAALNNGASPASVALAFLTSTEYRTDLVGSYYLQYLNRAADPGGLASWLAALQARATDQAVRAGILGSKEGYADWS